MARGKQAGKEVGIGGSSSRCETWIKSRTESPEEKIKENAGSESRQGYVRRARLVRLGAKECKGRGGGRSKVSESGDDYKGPS